MLNTPKISPVDSVPFYSKGGHLFYSLSSVTKDKIFKGFVAGGGGVSRLKWSQKGLSKQKLTWD